MLAQRAAPRHVVQRQRVDDRSVAIEQICLEFALGQREFHRNLPGCPRPMLYGLKTSERPVISTRAAVEKPVEFRCFPVRNSNSLFRSRTAKKRRTRRHST